MILIYYDKSKYHIVLLFFMGGFILSCKSIKPVENEKDKKILNTKKLVDSIKEYECEVEWIKLKSETSIKFEDEELEVTLNFRIKRDSLIWINASNYGVKIARAFIAKDSIKVQSEYPSKTYFKGTIDDFEKQYNLSISYPLIENFLLGNTYINELSEKIVLTIEKGNTIFFHIENAKQVVLYHKKLRNIQSIYINLGLILKISNVIHYLFFSQK